MRQRAIQCLPDLSFMTSDTKFEADESPEPSPKKARLNSTASDEENSNQCLCNRLLRFSFVLELNSPIRVQLDSPLHHNNATMEA